MLPKTKTCIIPWDVTVVKIFDTGTSIVFTGPNKAKVTSVRSITSGFMVSQVLSIFSFIEYCFTMIRAEGQLHTQAICTYGHAQASLRK